MSSFVPWFFAKTKYWILWYIMMSHTLVDSPRYIDFWDGVFLLQIHYPPLFKVWPFTNVRVRKIVLLIIPINSKGCFMATIHTDLVCRFSSRYVWIITAYNDDILWNGDDVCEDIFLGIDDWLLVQLCRCQVLDCESQSMVNVSCSRRRIIITHIFGNNEMMTNYF